MFDVSISCLDRRISHSMRKTPAKPANSCDGDAHAAIQTSEYTKYTEAKQLPRWNSKELKERGAGEAPGAGASSRSAAGLGQSRTPGNPKGIVATSPRLERQRLPCVSFRMCDQPQ